MFPQPAIIDHNKISQNFTNSFTILKYLDYIGDLPQTEYAGSSLFQLQYKGCFRVMVKRYEHIILAQKLFMNYCLWQNFCMYRSF